MVTGTGITVYANTAWIPERAQVASGAAAAASASTAPSASTALSAAAVSPPGSPVVAGAVPVLPGPAASRSYRGPLARGTVYAAVAPAERWSLIGSSSATAARSFSFGWVGTYKVTQASTATLRFRGGPWTPLSLLVSVVAWLAALALVSVRRLGGGWTRLRTGRRRTRTDRDDGVDSPSPDGPELAFGYGETP